jgi:hypothetical protein
MGTTSLVSGSSESPAIFPDSHTGGAKPQLPEYFRSREREILESMQHQSGVVDESYGFSAMMEEEKRKHAKMAAAGQRDDDRHRMAMAHLHYCERVFLQGLKKPQGAQDVPVQAAAPARPSFYRGGAPPPQLAAEAAKIERIKARFAAAVEAQNELRREMFERESAAVKSRISIMETLN